MVRPTIPRHIHIWTALKLEYLDNYLQAYIHATKRSRETHYIDAFAGCGECMIIETGYEVKGSPLRALYIKPSFTKYHFVEKKPMLSNHLRKVLFDKGFNNAYVYSGDCNQVIPTKVLSNVPQDVPSFAFLDPTGIQLNWQTIERLASHRKRWKMELLLLYPYDMAIARLFRLALSNRALYDAMTRFYGDESWKIQIDESFQKRETSDQRRERFVRLYTNKLQALGYRYVDTYGPLYSGHKPLYHVIFASDHPVGARIMKSVWSKTRFVPGEIGYRPSKGLSAIL